MIRDDIKSALVAAMKARDTVSTAAIRLIQPSIKNRDIELRTVDVHIRRLRLALEDSGHDHLVQTVRGSGYRFSATPN